MGVTDQETLKEQSVQERLEKGTLHYEFVKIGFVGHLHETCYWLWNTRHSDTEHTQQP
jgi:hypothetical protein